MDYKEAMAEERRLYEAYREKMRIESMSRANKVRKERLESGKLKRYPVLFLESDYADKLEDIMKKNDCSYADAIRFLLKAYFKVF